MTLNQLARSVLKAAEVHEKSWSKAEQRYKITIVDACNKVSQNSDIRQVSNLLLTCAWNDAINWAEEYTSGGDEA